MNQSSLFVPLAIGLVIAPVSVYRAHGASPVIVEGVSTTVNMDEDGEPTAFFLQLHATDDDGDALSWSITNAPVLGIADIPVASGEVVNVTYDPPLHYHGPDQFGVRVSDTNGGFDEITVDVDIAAQNDAPQLNINTGIQIYQLAEEVITSSHLAASDVDTNDASQLTFTVDPIDNGGAPQIGILARDGTPLDTGDTFTQQDINDGLMTFAAPITASGSDGFTFRVTDAEGAAAEDGGFSVFTFPILILFTNVPPRTIDSAEQVKLDDQVDAAFQASDTNLPPQTLTFRITQNGSLGDAQLLSATNGTFRYTHTNGLEGVDTIFFQVNDGLADAPATGRVTITVWDPNVPPVTVNGAAATHIGGQLASMFEAIDTNIPPQLLTFRITQNGAMGNAELLSATNGTFHYTHTNGMAGVDTIFFQANDGLLDAVVAGEFSVTVSNTPPTVTGASLVSIYGQTVTGKVDATDIDLPPQEVTFSIATAADRGSVALNPQTGAFTYTPATNRFGVDTFYVTANDGFMNANPGAVSISITHHPVEGDLFIGRGMENELSEKYGDIIVVDVTSGDSAIVTEGGLMTEPKALAYDPVRNRIYSTDVFFQAPVPRVIETDPESGAQRLVAEGGLLVIPTGLDIEADGSLVVSDLPTRTVVRINPETGTQTVVTAGGYLQAPTGIEVLPNGHLLVLDAMNPQAPDGMLLEVNPTNGLQTLIISNSTFVVPFDLATSASGIVHIVDLAGLLITVDLATSNMTVIGSKFNFSSGIDSPDRKQMYHVTSRNLGEGITDGSVRRIDSDTQGQSVVAEEGFVNAAMWGLAAMPPMGWIRSVFTVGDNVGIGWHSVSGVLYRVDSTLQLNPPSWSPESTVTGSGGWMNWTSPVPPPSPFYLRVVGWPEAP